MAWVRASWHQNRHQRTCLPLGVRACQTVCDQLRTERVGHVLGHGRRSCAVRGLQSCEVHQSCHVVRLGLRQSCHEERHGCHRSCREVRLDVAQNYCHEVHLNGGCLDDLRSGLLSDLPNAVRSGLGRCLQSVNRRQTYCRRRSRHDHPHRRRQTCRRLCDRSHGQHRHVVQRAG